MDEFTDNRWLWRLARSGDAFGEFRHRSDIGCRFSELKCRLHDSDCGALCEVARRLPVPGKVGGGLGQRLLGGLRPARLNRVCDLLAARPLDIATDGKLGLPVFRNAFS